MKIWIIADTHFNHHKMFEKNYRLEKMYERMIADSFNKINEATDILIHLGDICMGRDADMHEVYIKPYKFKKYLILGNHDNQSMTWYLNHGWDFVANSFTLHRFGMKLIFTHVPMSEVPEDHINIHGHLHGGHRDKDFDWLTNRHKLIALEELGYEVIDLRKFLNC